MKGQPEHLTQEQKTKLHDVKFLFLWHLKRQQECDTKQENREVCLFP